MAVRISRSTRTWRTFGACHEKLCCHWLRNTPTHLVHLEERPLLHLLQRTHLPRVCLACKVDLTISTLADLRDDLELVDLELDTALAEEGAFATAVGLEFVGVLLLSEIALRGVLVEAGTAVLAGSDVTEEVEVVVEEIWKGGGRAM